MLVKYFSKIFSGPDRIEAMSWTISVIESTRLALHLLCSQQASESHINYTHSAEFCYKASATPLAYAAREKETSSFIFLMSLRCFIIHHVHQISSITNRNLTGPFLAFFL